jgi:hypothetical protein
VHKGPAPIEVSQKLVHPLDIHYIPERNAYCRLDGNGDIEDVIRIMTLPIDEQLEGREVVTILRKDLDIYMAVADLALVIKFDFTRTVRGSFSGWNDLSRYHRDGEDLFTMAVQPLVPAALCTALWLCAHKQPWLNRKRRGAGILKGFYPISTDGLIRAENFRSCRATLRRIRGL